MKDVGIGVTGKRRRGPRGLKRAWTLGAGAALGLTALALPRAAEAQDRTFYLDRLNIGGAPDDGVALWRPQMGQKTRFFGQFGLGFSLNPLRLENEIDDLRKRQQARSRGVLDPVDAQLIGYFNAGVEISDRFAIQVGLPATFYQKANVTSASSPTLTSNAGTQVAALNDLRLDARVIALRNNSRSFKAGVSGSLWLPTGTESAYGGFGSTHGALGLSLEFDPKKFFVVLNTGMHFSGGGGLNDFQVEHEWTYGAGVFLPLRDNKIRLGAEVFGSAPVGKGSIGPNTPLEWMLEGRMALGEKKQTYIGASAGTRMTSGYSPDFRGMAMIGTSFGIDDVNPPSPGKRWRNDRTNDNVDTDKDGLPDNIDLCPTDPEDGKPPAPDDGCPALPDRDGDGIPDMSDKCPDEPEDFDGIDDRDGCPEDDADEDGFPDAQDACPKEPGEASADPAKNGCPQFIRRISGSNEIQILKQVQFATGKATILPNSYPILDEVVRLLKANPEITHLDIEGHTDNRGPNALNERLSQDRSDSVMAYLVSHGIEAGKLAAKGYGPARPIASNDTAEGRQANRRVEFHIRDQGDAPQK